MAQRHDTDNQDRTTEPEFYIPAGGGPSVVADRVEHIWASLFDQQVGRRK